MKVALVDDHEIFRQALRLLLPHADPTMDIVAEAATARDAVLMIQRVRPDVVVMDILFPERNGLVAIRELRRLGSQTRVLILSALSAPSSIADAFAAGANGYALKTQPVEDIVTAIRKISNGFSYLPRTSGEGLSKESSHRAQKAGRLIDVLSIREREVFDLVIAGHTNQKMATLCFISTKTIETHRMRINKKLHTHSTGDLFRFAVLHDLVHAS